MLGDQTGPGRFREPRGLALGQDGTIVVVEGGSHRVQRLSPEGTSLAVLAGPGDGRALGVWGVPSLIPTALRANDAGNLTVVSGNDPRVHRVAPDGTSAVIGVPPEYRPTRQLGSVRATFEPDGRAYVALRDVGELRRHAADGTPEAEIRLAGLGASAAKSVDGLAVDAMGRLFVSRTSTGYS